MSETIERLAPWATSQLWQVTAVAVAVGVTVRLCCRRRPHLAYMLWMLVVIKCLTPPVWSSPTGVFSWVGARHVSPAAASSADDAQFAVTAKNDPWMPRIEEGLLPQPADVTTDSVQPVAGASSQRENSTSPATVAAAIWIAGCLVFLGILIGKRIVCGVALRRSGDPADAPLAAAVRELSERLGVRQKVRVLAVTRPIGPAVYGVLRPTILLPRVLLEEKSLDRLKPILAHELAHVRRGDPAAGLLQLVAQLVWWFHPLIWWANRQLCRERERLCDEEAVAALQCPPHAYAQSLLDIVKLRHRLRPVVGLPGVRPFDITRQRLENIMNRTTEFHPRMPRPYWLVLAAGVLLLIPGSGLTLRSHAQAAGEQSVDKQDSPQTESDKDSAASDVADPAEQEAVAALEELGARIERDEDGGVVWVDLNKPRVTDSDLRHLTKLTWSKTQTLVGNQPRPALNLRGTQVTDAGLEHLRQLTSLRLLWLDDTQVTDAGLENLTGLTNLGWLSLRHDKITDTGLEHLKGLRKLFVLKLMATEISDAGLMHLKELTDLAALELTGTSISGTGLEHLEGSKITWLWIDSTNLTNANMVHLEGMTKLESVFLGKTGVTDAGLVHLLELPNFSMLGLDAEQITDAAVTHLTAMDSLKHLSMANNEFTGTQLDKLGRLENLESLWLEGSKIEDAALEQLKGLTGLERLNLSATDITDAGIDHLQGLTNLKDLYLLGTKVTDAGVNKLKQALPNCEIRFAGTAGGSDADVQQNLGAVSPSQTTGQVAASEATQVPLRTPDAQTSTVQTEVREGNEKEPVASQPADPAKAEALYQGEGEAIAALAELRKLGITIVPEPEANAAVVQLWLRGPEVTDTAMVHVGAITTLRHLALGNDTRVTDAGMKHLENLKELRSFSAAIGTNITDDVLYHLEGLGKLTTLRLTGDGMTDKGIQRLEKFTQLQSLALVQTSVSEYGLGLFLPKLKKLKSLTLTGSPVGSGGLAHARELHDLEALLIAKTQVPADDLKHLSGLGRLNTLGLGGTQFRGFGRENYQVIEGVEQLSLVGLDVDNDVLRRLDGLQGITWLMLYDVRVTDEGLQHLRKLPNLRWLGLASRELPAHRRFPISNAGIESLKNLPSLRTLRLEGRQFDDNVVGSLKKLSHLDEIIFAHSSVTRDGVSELQTALPYTKVKNDYPRE